MNGDREIFIFPVQLTTCRIGNLTLLIHTLDICVTMTGAVSSMSYLDRDDFIVLRIFRGLVMSSVLFYSLKKE